MSLDDLVGLLARAPAFAGMGRGPLMYVAQYAMPRYLEPGDVLFREGEQGVAAYLVVHGTAITIGESGSSDEIGSGELIGELTMIAEVAYPTTCVADTRLTVLEISRPLIHGLLQQDAGALQYMRGRLGRRLEEIRSNLEQVQLFLSEQPEFDAQELPEMALPEMEAPEFALPGEARMDGDFSPYAGDHAPQDYDQDQSEPPPEYDRMEPPSPAFRRPVAA